jgi:hypothetical protein
VDPAAVAKLNLISQQRAISTLLYWRERALFGQGELMGGMEYGALVIMKDTGTCVACAEDTATLDCASVLLEFAAGWGTAQG